MERIWDVSSHHSTIGSKQLWVVRVEALFVTGKSGWELWFHDKNCCNTGFAGLIWPAAEGHAVPTLPY
jgi:hypothetical protein